MESLLFSGGKTPSLSFPPLPNKRSPCLHSPNETRAARLSYCREKPPLLRGLLQNLQGEEGGFAEQNQLLSKVVKGGLNAGIDFYVLFVLFQGESHTARPALLWRRPRPSSSSTEKRHNNPQQHSDDSGGQRAREEKKDRVRLFSHIYRESVEKKVNDSNAAREKIHGDCEQGSGFRTYVGERSAFAGEEITFSPARCMLVGADPETRD